MFRFRNDCSSHPIKIIVYIKLRLILRNWESIFFKTYLSTITSFIFHTGATVQQQQNQLYRPFFMFSKGIYQPSNSKNCFGQMEFNLTKMREVFIPNSPIIKNSFIFYTVITGWENLKYLHRSLFQKYTILLYESSASKEYFEEIEMIFEK